MNLTWHIIRKDITRNRWGLLLWSVGLGYLIVQSGAGFPKYPDYLGVAALLVVLVLGVGLVADIVQVDHPASDAASWRTMPISGRRMVLSKFLMLAAVFVALPVGITVLRNVFGTTQSMRNFREYSAFTLLFSTVTFSVAATAACTRNLLQCLLLWIVLVFGAVTLGEFLGRFAPALTRPQLFRMGLDKVFLVLGLSLATGLAVMFNQYVRRRAGLSVLLLLAGAVGTATITAFWGYFYFYHA